MAKDKGRQARLVLLCGLPASGKTTLAHRLAESYGAVRLNRSSKIAQIAQRSSLVRKGEVGGNGRLPPGLA